uniref:VanZ family protein n=1 Tax=candidate division WOR-3 bacterium TaxID=2052148 RepID=A0A7C6ECX0_UNCW3
MLILWIIVILFLSLIPTPEAPKLQETGVDKVLHFGAYALLGMIAQSAVGFHSLSIGISLGTITELLQYMVPHRSVEFFDWLANVLGLGLGIGAYFLVRKVL